ncbi:unnamed protein product [Scytosiphon promiscuus]
MPAFWHDLLGGTVGGVVGMTVVYPLDTVKCRLQTTTRYKGTLDVLTSMARKEGLMSWYRGLLSPVAGYGTMFAISFSSYGMAGRLLLRRRQGDGGADGELTLWEKSVAGFCAGIVNSPFRVVFERVKSVMQVRRGKELQAPYSWSGACAVDLVRREHVIGEGQSTHSTTLRESVQCAIYYPSYAMAKDFLIPKDGPRMNIPEPMLQMVSGGVAGCATWVPPVYFFDVIKTRMQTAEPGVYNGVLDCLTKTVRVEGIQALFRGLGVTMLRAIPMHGLVFVGYEATIDFLGARSASAST